MVGEVDRSETWNFIFLSSAQDPEVYWTSLFGFFNKQLHPTMSQEFSFLIFFFFALQYCIGFAIHQHESAPGVQE